ncbi:hypothetical protein [Coraliomargarita parva]|uniref:hypothetical protein n=1 Tax=Coraliomargarita parva TaxID=3014050 RepID=UPI0022B5AC4B|nr:hypothetical protein [Coraliomargarita parva]
MNREQLKADLQFIAQVSPLPAGESMISVLQRLDAVAAEPGIPERLEHYLSKRSYLKALAWLDNPELPHEV